jgi:hypothetical protein
MRKPSYLNMSAERLRDRIRMARLIAHVKGLRPGLHWFILGGSTPWD